MKVLFHCDAAKATGAGHLVRSIALAEAAVDSGHEVLFAGTFESSFAVEAMRRRDIPFRSFAGTTQELVALAQGACVDLIHCDSYTAPLELYEAARACGVLLSNLEDGRHGARRADIIIDPSPGAEMLYRSDASSSIHLRGLQYLPLRKAVGQVAKERSSRRHTVSARPTALIMMGGTDAAGLSESVVSLWTTAVPHSDCYVVKPGLDHERVDRVGSCTVRWISASEDVIALFGRVDAAVSAAGTTVWELLAAHVPTAILTQADNQMDNYRYVTSRKFMLPLGDVSSIRTRADEIQSSMSQVLNFDPRVDLEIDSQGASRIVSEWEMISSPSSTRLALREARPSDASNLFSWRNDAAVRRMSRDTRPLQWADHLVWLRRSLTRSDRQLFIAHLGRDVAGTVRFDALPSDTQSWEISIALNPAMRGRGLGTRLLAQGENALRSRTSGDVTVVASVRHDNEPSTRLFKNAGYLARSERNGAFVEWRKSLSR